MSNNWYYIGNVESIEEKYGKNLVDALKDSTLIVFHGNYAFFTKEEHLNDLFLVHYKPLVNELSWDEAKPLMDFYKDIFEDDYSEYIEGELSDYALFVDKDDLFDMVVREINRMNKEQFRKMNYKDIVIKEAKKIIIQGLKEKIKEFESDLTTV